MNLSKEQNYAFEKFKLGENLFITGPGGTGKTQLIKHLVSYMKIKGIDHQVCALTGCAAVLLKCNARTLHSWSGIKLARGPIEKIVSSVIYNPRIVSAWKKTKVLIVDEVSMLSKKIFEVIERIARTIKGNQRPFGGIQVIFTGDFYQLPPVGSPEEPSTSQFCFESEKWGQVFQIKNHIKLVTVFRQTDETYIRILNEIREGNISEENRQILNEKIGIKPPDDYIAPTKLYAIRSKTDFVNRARFSKIQEPEHIYERIIKTDCVSYTDSGRAIDTNLLNICKKLNPQEIEFEINHLSTNSNIQQRAILKKGALVMLTYNINIEEGICNGSQGIITDFKNNTPIVRFTNGLEIPIDYQYIQSEEYPMIAVGQIPLTLAWAMTIHKIQGATLETADMDLGNSVFEYGQIYVALSRVKSLDGLYLSAFHPQKIRANPIVKQFYMTFVEPEYESHIENIFETYRYQEEEAQVAIEAVGEEAIVEAEAVVINVVKVESKHVEEVKKEINKSTIKIIKL
jgi:ATP-dependent DNA helicase PIF1